MQARRRQGRPPVIEMAHDRILDEAARLFGQKGFDASSISELASVIGVSKAAIFHYFPAKQDIYDAIILRTLKGLTDTVSVAVSNERPGAGRLKSFMLSHAVFFEDNYWFFVTMLIGFGGMGPTPLKEEVLILRDAHEATLRHIISEGIETGEFRDTDVVDVGRAVLSMLNWMARWFTPGGERSAAAIAEAYYEIIVNGLWLSDKG